MGLLSPLMLLGALGVAAPLWLHLVARESPTGSPFPSLMFVKRIPVQVERRRKLRDPLLFALRCLGLLALVLAFSGPYVLGGTGRTDVIEPPPPAAGPLLIAMDLSLSMRAGQRWSRAREAALQLLDELPAERPAGLIGFARDARLLGRPGTDRARLRAVLEDLEPGFGPTRYAPALRLAGQVLTDPARGGGAGAVGGVGEVVLVTDGQEAGLPAGRALPLPPGVAMRVHRVASEADEESAGVNLAVVAVRAGRHGAADAGGPGSSEYRGQVEVTVRNYSARAVDGARVTVATGAAVPEASGGGGAGSIGRRSADLPRLEAHREAVVPLDIDLLENQPTRIAARIVHAGGADALPEDDVGYAVAQAGRPVAVLVIAAPPPAGGDGAGDGSGARRTPAFIDGALALARRPRVVVRHASAARPLEGALAGADVAILDALSVSSSDDAAALLDHVARGGALVVLADTGASDAASWSESLRDALPATPGPVVDTGDTPAPLLPRSAPHPVADALGDPMAGGLASAEVFRHRELTPGPDSVVLARASDGAPLLLERTHGRGRILQLATSLEPDASTLALASGFTSWWIATMRYLAGLRPPAGPYRVGDHVDLDSLAPAVPGEGPGTGLVVEAPDGEAIRLDAARAILRPSLPGFYDLHLPGRSGPSGAAAIAVNLPPEESNLSPAPPGRLAERLEALRAASPGPGAVQTEGAQARSVDPAEAAESMIWWYLAAAGLLALALETWLAARRRSPSRANPEPYRAGREPAASPGMG